MRLKLKDTALFLLLTGTTAFAQISSNEKITINANSNAFLDASKNTTGQGSNIGRGLLFPQTDLSTFTLDISAADGINYPTYFDGMIVYNTHEGDATTDPSLTTQTENLEKGFYYFSNPTGKDTQSIENGKWVKISDAQANASEWKYNPDNERIELVRSGKGDFKNKVYYDKNGGFYNYDSPEFYNGKEVKNIETDKIPYINFEQKNAKEIPFDDASDKVQWGSKTKNILNIDDNTTGKLNIANNENITQTLPGYSGTLETISGQSSSAILNGGTVRNLIGNAGSASINSGYVKGYSAGQQGVISVNGEQGGSWNDFMAGWFRTTLGSNEDLNVSRAKGMLVETWLGGNNINVSQRLTGISINSNFNENASGSIANQYGMIIGLGSQPSALKISNKYGILIGNIIGGKSNYAIYTNKGKVNFGDEVTVHAQDWSDEEKARRKKNVLRIDLPNTNINDSADDITSSIVGSRVDFNPNYAGVSIDFGLTNTNVQTNPFLAFSVAPREGTPSEKDMTVERMRINSSGNVGIGTKSPTEKLEVNGTIKATKINFTGLPTYENDTEAGTGGLVAGDCYKTSTGELRIKL